MHRHAIGGRRVGTPIHSETPVERTRVWFLSTMTVNVLFNSAVVTGVTQKQSSASAPWSVWSSTQQSCEISAQPDRGVTGSQCLEVGYQTWSRGAVARGGFVP